MPLIKYPLRQRTPDDPPQPLLPVQITNPHTGIFVQSWGLIDTGAADCVITSDIAEFLGHDLFAGQEVERTAAGGIVKDYLHTLEIDIFGVNHNFDVDYNDIIHTVPETLITCMPGLPIILLGVKDFLENFTLMIDYPNKLFSLV